MPTNALRGGRFLALAALAALGAAAAQWFGLFIAGALGVPTGSPQSTLIADVMGALPAVICMVALGGSSWASCSRNDVGFTFRFAWWLLAVSAGLSVYFLVRGAFSGAAPVAGWQGRLAFTALACVAIGVFEEFVFRGLVLNGLLAVWGDKHRGVLAAIVVTSLLFGVAHVNLSVVSGGVLGAVEVLVRVAQMAIYSAVLCTVVLHTRCLVGVCLLHALDDLLLAFPGTVLWDMPLGALPVANGDALITLAFDALVLVLYIPLLVKVRRAFR